MDSYADLGPGGYAVGAPLAALHPGVALPRRRRDADPVGEAAADCISAAAELLRAHACLGRIDPETLDTLAAAADILRLKRGEMLVPRGWSADDALFVLDGTLSIEVPVSGREALLLDTVGGDELLLGMRRMLAAGAVLQIRAEAASLAAHVPGRTLRALAARDPAFAWRLLEASAQRSRRLFDHMVNARGRTAIGRIARYLVELLPRDAANNAVVTLPVSKQSAARLLDLTGPSFSRALRRMIDDGLLCGGGRRLRILDRSRLERLAAP